MTVKAYFTNLSFYKKTPEITLFQPELFTRDTGVIAWKVIQNCGYQWEHKFNIERGYSYRYFDAFGTYTRLFYIDNNNGITTDEYCTELKIQHVPHTKIIFHKIKHNKFIGVQLLKNGNCISTELFNRNECVVFQLSNCFAICADTRTQQGEVIHPSNLNISLQKFSITTKNRINIIMKGGGYGSSAIPFLFDITQEN